MVPNCLKWYQVALNSAKDPKRQTATGRSGEKEARSVSAPSDYYSEKVVSELCVICGPGLSKHFTQAPALSNMVSEQKFYCK